MINKKGDVSELKGWILTIVLLIMFLSFSANLGGFITSKGDDVKCGASLLKATTLGKFSEHLTTLNCNNLPDVEIKKSKFVQGSTINENAIYSTITNRMTECWDLVGKGSFDPHEALGGDQTYCLVCADVTFDDDFKEVAKQNSQPPLTNLMFWQASQSPPGMKESYFKKLYGITPDTSTIRAMENSGGPIDYNQPYVVVWTLQKSQFSKVAAGTTAVAFMVAGGKLGAALGSVVPVVGTLGGAVVGTAAGAIGAYFVVDYNDQQVASGVHFVPRSQLGEDVTFTSATGSIIKKPFCTKLVNS